MKKYIKISLVILLVLFILVIWYRNIPAPKRIKNMVLDNRMDYETIAKICYNDYKNYYNYSNLTYSGGQSGELRCITLDYYIELNYSESASFQKIYDSFLLDNKTLECIRVYDTFVSFCIVNGRESIVYSAENKRPSYINNPNDKNKHIAVEKIADHWYYVYDNGWS